MKVVKAMAGSASGKGGSMDGGSVQGGTMPRASVERGSAKEGKVGNKLQERSVPFTIKPDRKAHPDVKNSPVMLVPEDNQ